MMVTSEWQAESDRAAAELADYLRALLAAGFTRDEAVQIITAWSMRPIPSQVKGLKYDRNKRLPR